MRSLPSVKPEIHETAIITNTTFLGDSRGYLVSIGAYSVIGKQGFGYNPVTHERWNHQGRVIIGLRVDIGANTCIDRGNLTDTIIGDDTKIDNLVHIGHGAHIGEKCYIVAGAVIGGSAEIGNNCFIGMNASIRQKIKIGNNCTIGAGAVVVKDVADNTTVIGNPAKPISSL